jgi:hypothetical protein
MQTRPPQVSLLSGSCSSDRDFASGFLQIPRRRGHPCLRLVVPTTKPTADFHRQVIAHAGRTYKKAREELGPICAITQIPRLSPIEIAQLNKPGQFIETVLQLLTAGPANNTRGYYLLRQRFLLHSVIASLPSYTKDS